MPPLSLDALLLLEQADHGVRRLRVVLGRVDGVGAEHGAGRFDDHGVHAVAEAQVRDVVLARVLGRGDLALEAALAEAARHDDRVDAAQLTGDVVVVDLLGLNPEDLDSRVEGSAGVDQRFFD